MVNQTGFTIKLNADNFEGYDQMLLNKANVHILICIGFDCTCVSLDLLKTLKMDIASGF